MLPRLEDVHCHAASSLLSLLLLLLVLLLLQVQDGPG
jgi:hypothetical protein